ncbi:MAG: 30S ribosomal protein S3 [Candidatus Omnitrophica bacterium]|nr:30S ribosomal protein S3 [Candidatus Omnitrophota bacterium]
MGQKVHPYGLRVGYIKTWRSRWFARKKDFANLLHEDIRIKNYIKKNFSSAAIPNIEIERASDRVRVIIFSARPGIIIGRKGADIDRLREDLNKLTDKEIYIDIKEIKSPYTEAQLVAENIAFQLVKRVAFRRAMKRALQLAMDNGAGGIRIRCSGRLGGAEIARSEKYMKGKIPLQTFRADIDYGFCEAHTTYGLIGIKVWLYKGDVIIKKVSDSKESTDAPDAKKG